ncbi:hypothetical protein ACOSQ2_009128 [Xanthoceras sorbifolium]
MERKGCCGGSRSQYKSSSCVSRTPPKKETKTSCYVSTSCVSTPKREQPVKKTQVSQEETTSQIPKTEEEEKQQAVTVKQEEPVKVNVGN